ncbi:hypothetical protein [Halobacillus salinus]|uniref:hypothetical protein n=1 Tax=Halobacillus salinus TaxID=192814 RepID=UPI0009A8F7DA|nr:hypothetical protein [Halobacillus salinus]
MDAVKGMSSVVCFSPQQTEEERKGAFVDWYQRSGDDRMDKAFHGQKVPNAKQTRAMLKERMGT